MLRMRIRIILSCYVFFQLQLLAIAIAQDRYLLVISSQIKRISEDNSTFKTDENIFGKWFKIASRDSLYYKCSHPTFGNTKFLIHPINKDYLITPFHSHYIYASSIPDSRICQKVVFIKQPRLTNVNEESNFKPPYFDNYKLEGKPLGFVDITQFSFAYCFARTNDAILVGTSNRINIELSDEIIMGWVDKKNLAMWNNRIAIEFNKNNFHERKNCELGKIFISERGLIQNIPNLLFVEEENTDSSMPFYANRFPVINVSNNGERIKVVATKKIIDKTKKEKYEKELKKLHALQNHKKIQIAIVIDISIDCKNICKTIKDSIELFFRQYPKYLPQDFVAELALVVFQGYKDDKLGVEIKSPFTNKQEPIVEAIKKDNLMINKNFILNSSIFSNDPIYPISFAVYFLNWYSNKLGEKYLLFVINGKSLKDNKLNNENDNNVLGTLLKEKSISLYVLKLNSHLASSKKNLIFDKKIKNILSANDNFGNLKQVNHNSSKQLIIFDELKEILQQHKTKIERFQEIVNNSHCPRQISTRCGYISKFNKCKQKQIVEKVLMTKKDIESLRVQMQILSDAVRYYDPQSPEEFDFVVYKVVKTLTGDKLQRYENIKEFILKKIGVPINTPFLDKSLDELKYDVSWQKKRNEFRKYLEEKLIYLEQVTRESKIKNKGWDDGEKTFRWNDTETPIPYFFSLEQPLPKRGKEEVDDYQKRYAWVPLEYLP